jgi:hypothetical protein
MTLEAGPYIIFSIFCNKFGSVRTGLQNELNIMHSGYEDDEFFSLDQFGFDRIESNFLKKNSI